MTAQVREALFYEGDKLSMANAPLSAYFDLGGRCPDFQAAFTFLGRGYVGTWEICEGRLYLIGLHGALVDGTQATLETMFPGFPDRVFAHWFTGGLRIPQGALLKHRHMGWSSLYETDLFLHCEEGVLVRSETIRNPLPVGPAGGEQL